jgi:hypothetical protein
MPQLQKAPNPPPAAAATPIARLALATAIDERDAAVRALDDASGAAEKAREAYYSAEDRAADLRKFAAEAEKSPDEVVAALSSGGDIDILNIERPRAELLAQIEVADEKVSAWRRALDLAEGAVPVRERAVDWAERKVKQRAAEVFATQIDVPKLLAEAEQAAQMIVGLRVRLMFVRSLIPSESPEHAAVDHFLSRPWLLHEYSDTWKCNSAIAPYRAAFEALLRDSEAKINCAP